VIIRQLTLAACAQQESQLRHDRKQIEVLMGAAQTRAAVAEREHLTLGRSLSAIDALLEEVIAHKADLESQEPAGGRPEPEVHMET
jgi:outer membrane protein TolC